MLLSDTWSPESSLKSQSTGQGNLAGESASSPHALANLEVLIEIAGRGLSMGYLAKRVIPPDPAGKH